MPLHNNGSASIGVRGRYMVNNEKPIKETGWPVEVNEMRMRGVTNKDKSETNM